MRRLDLVGKSHLERADKVAPPFIRQWFLDWVNGHHPDAFSIDAARAVSWQEINRSDIVLKSFFSEAGKVCLISMRPLSPDTFFGLDAGGDIPVDAIKNHAWMDFAAKASQAIEHKVSTAPDGADAGGINAIAFNLKCGITGNTFCAAFDLGCFKGYIKRSASHPARLSERSDAILDAEIELPLTLQLSVVSAASLHDAKLGDIVVGAASVVQLGKAMIAGNKIELSADVGRKGQHKAMALKR